MRSKAGMRRGFRKIEVGINWKSELIEVGSRNELKWEVGMRNSEKKNRGILNNEC